MNTDNDLKLLIKKFDDFTPQVKQLQRYKTKPLKWLYNGFVPRSVRKNKEKQAKITQQQHLADCWHKLITLYQQKQLPIFEIKAKKQFTHQNIIWQYWGQGINDNLPDIVKLCFQSVDKYKNDFIIIRLDDKSLDNYLQFPKFITKKRENLAFKPAFFADLLRLSLLYHYGGVWIDATILLTAPIDRQILAQDFFMFSRSQNASDKAFWENFNSDYFGWSSQHYVNILNSFIVAKKHNKLISDCLNIMLNFWNTQNFITHYFFFQIMFDVLIENYGKNYSFGLKIDDTKPHLLQAKMNEPFNQKIFNDICQKTNIHKMTYNHIVTEKSYFYHLKTIIS